MTPEEARNFLKANRGNKDPELFPQIAKAREVLQALKRNPSAPPKRRGRPAVTDPSSRTPKTRIVKIKNFDDYPLVNLFLKGSAKLVKHLSKLSDDELKEQSKMSLRAAKKLVSGKPRGRPSELDSTRRVVAHEMVKRFGTAVTKSVPVRKSKEVRDRFRARRKERKKARKSLPNKPESED